MMKKTKTYMGREDRNVDKQINISVIDVQSSWEQIIKAREIMMKESRYGITHLKQDRKLETSS